MKYKVVIDKKAKKKLSKIDKQQTEIILNWIYKNLNNCSDPYSKGKRLKGNLSKYWRYRVGNYRLFADINDDIITITIVNIGHRRDIYTN